jgi:sphingomyelin phosphodiesterase
LLLLQDSIVQVAKHSPLSSSELCSALLKCQLVRNPAFHWDLALPPVAKPPVGRAHSHPEANSPVFRILQLSDLHVDFEYQPGSIAECGQPLCCRNASTLGSTQKQKHPFLRGHAQKNRSQLAGYWGDYRNCDIPLWTLENMFEHISNNEKVTFFWNKRKKN